ncbi:YcnI family protein [Catenulispora rubra]|uniref:YcnI family protein n=1 Tax=Catenulispora rubra TaxID=280293 RepID=UPI0018924744|nr:YcnI family protein [Catenulispora rubra]
MSTKLTSGTRRTTVLLATAAVSLVAAASAAEAHVTVNPNTEPQGGYAKVSFRVPNEEANASTTSLEVDIPVDHPIASVSVRPVPGWTATATTSQLATPIKTDDGQVTQAVSKIVWTGGKIDPGQFQEFDVSLGPLPKDTDKIVFKALQTYSDGNVVRWIDVQQPGQAEPDHPAPVLHLTPAAGTSTGTSTATGNTATGAPTTAPSVSLAADANANTNPAAKSAGTSDTAARTLGIAGLGIGVLGFATAIVALRRKNNQPS